MKKIKNNNQEAFKKGRVSVAAVLLFSIITLGLILSYAIKQKNIFIDDKTAEVTNIKPNEELLFQEENYSDTDNNNSKNNDTVITSNDAIIANGAGNDLDDLISSDGSAIVTNESGDMSLISYLGAEIDISGETNLKAGEGLRMEGDSLRVTSSIARDSELHDALTLSGEADYLTLVGQDIVRGLIDLTAHVSGVLPIANGGTGVSDGSPIFNNLSLDGNFSILESGINPIFYTTFRSADQVGDIVYTLPVDAPASDNYVLTAKTDGTMSWSSVSGTGGVSGIGTAGQATYWIDANTITGENYLSVSRGGIGVNGSLVTDGQILIGNDGENNFSLASIASGSGIIVTNGAGSITLASTLGTAIDISDETNLMGDAEIILTGDSLSIASSIARDSELHNAVTLGTANGLSLNAQTLSLTVANSTTAGALNSTDWNAFNNKLTLPTLTSGSVLFSDGTTIAQDNTNLFWDDTNNRLGIGTINPGYALDISGAINSSGYLYSGTTIITSSGSNRILRAPLTGGLVFQVNSATDAMTLLSDGNVGIGTTSPIAKLAVNGDIQLGNSLYFIDTNNKIFADQSTGTGFDFFLNNQNIGSLNRYSTNNAQMLLSQYSTGNTADNAPAYTFLGDTDTGLTLFGADQLSLTTGGDTKVLINSSGNVGIGTTTPGGRLEIGSGGQILVSGGSTAVPEYSFSGDIDTGITTNGTANTLYFSTGGIQRWRVTNSFAIFNVPMLQGRGIESMPVYGFDNDNIGMWSPGEDLLAFSTNGSEKLRIDNNGNVGIGTIAPGYLLEVNGTSKFNSTARFGTVTPLAGYYLNTQSLFVSQNAIFNQSIGIGTTAPGYELDVVGDANISGTLTVGTLTATNLSSTSAVSAPYFTATDALGTSTFAGGISISGNIIPTADNTYSLGSATNMWKDVYIGPGSLYINGKKVIQEASESMVFSADLNQNLIVQTSGSGDIELNPVDTGMIQLKGNVQLTAGKTFRTSTGVPLNFSDGILASNLSLTGNLLSAANINGSLELSANGLGAVYVTTGNFGVGTTGPLEKLDVAGRVHLAQTTAPSTVTDRLYNVGGSLYWNGVDVSGGGTGATQWTTSGTNIYYNGGNVGIGITSPLEKLHNVGNFRNEGTFKTGSGTEPGRWRFRDTSGYLMSFWTDATNYDTWGLYWDGSPNKMIWRGNGVDAASVDLDSGEAYFAGNVGIGTASPGFSLDVQGSSAVLNLKSTLGESWLVADSPAKAGMMFKRNGIQKWITYNNNIDDAYNIGTNTSDVKLSILNNGNVGIGTTTPTNLLTIKKADTSGEIMSLLDSTGAKVLGFGTTGSYATVSTGLSNAGIWFQNNLGFSNGTGFSNVNAGGSLRFNSDASVDIRTNTNIPYARFYSASAGLSIGSGYASTASPTNGLLVEGNVGIGTTSPTAYLHIKAGTATAGTAPLKFTSGVLNTTAEAGAMEFDGTNLYFSPSAGTRKVIGYTDGSNITHSGLLGLTNDDHTQYALLAGRLNGQTLIGGSAITDILKLQGTSGNGTLTSPSIQGLVGNNGATVALTVLNDGKVGVGTTTPGALLNVNGNSLFGTSVVPGGVAGTVQIVGASGVTPLVLHSNGAAAFSWYSVQGGTDMLTGSFSYANSTTAAVRANLANLSLGAGGIDNLVTIQSGGNVGIGTTSPTGNLDVSFSSGAGVSISKQLANDSTVISTYGATGNLYFKPKSEYTVFQSNSSVNSTMQIESSGGYAQVRFYNSTGDNRIITNSGNLTISPASNTIISSGNVGIGTTTPSTQFHTTGGVRLAGIADNYSNRRMVVSDTSGNLSYRNLDNSISLLDAPFGQYALYSPTTNNLLYSADKRFTVTQTGFSATNAASLFNSNYDENYNKIAASGTGVININLIDKGEYGTNGLLYSYGWVYLHFYHTQIPASASVRLKTKNAGGTFEWRTPVNAVNIATDDRFVVYKIPLYGNYICSDIEITINSGAVETHLAEVEFILNRSVDSKVQPIVSKSLSNSLYDSMLWKDSSNVLKAGIYPSTGNGYFAGNVGIGTTTPGAKLDVVGTISTADGTNGYMTMNTDSSALRTGYLEWKLGNGTRLGFMGDSASNITLALENSANFVVGGGNVGIGTDTPGAKLDIGLAGTSLGTLRLAGSTSGYIQIQPSAAAGSWTMTLPGAVGSAGQQLTDVNGDGITSWAAAGSLRSLKNIDSLVADPSVALNQIVNTPIYNFHYKKGMGTGDADTQYVGVMADEAAWAMHYDGNVINPVNTLGYMVLGVKALDNKIATISDGQNDQISNLILKTDSNITDLTQLQTSIDGQLAVAGENISELFFADDVQELKITNLENNNLTQESRLTQLENILSTQTAELEELTDQGLDFAYADLFATVLNIDDEGVDILNIRDFSAEITETGMMVVKVKDDNDATIGTAVICSALREVDENGQCSIEQADENNDNLDDNTGNAINDGKSVTVKTGAVKNSFKVFVTLKSKLTKEATLMVTDIKESESFAVELVNPTEEDVTFDWWIVEMK